MTTYVLVLLLRLPSAAIYPIMTVYLLWDRSLSFSTIGVLAGTATLLGAFAGPWHSRRVDRLGAWQALWWAPPVALVGWTGMWWLPTEYLLGAAVVVGIASLPMMALTRVVLFRQNTAAQAANIDALLTELAFVVGPGVGLWAASAHASAAYLVAVGVYALSAVLCMTLHAAAQNDSQADSASSTAPQPRTSGNAQSPLPWPVIAGLCLANAALAATLVGTDQALVAHFTAIDRRELAGLAVALWTAGALVGATMGMFFTVRVTPLLTLPFLALSTAALSVSWPLWAMLVMAFVAGLPGPSLLASVTKTTADVAPPGRTTEVFAWVSSFYALGVAVGLAVAGRVTDTWGPAATALLAASWCLPVAVGLLVARRQHTC